MGIYKTRLSEIKMMNLTDLKIYLLNASVLAINFTNIELGLKIILTIVAIGYTAHKWYLMYRNNG